MALKPFEKWTYEELDIEFGYQRVMGNFPVLDTWLSHAQDIVINDRDAEMVEVLRQDLKISVIGHNEEELKMHFITPILNIVKMGRTNVYKLFAQRNIAANVTNKKGITDKLGGRVEAMVALGTQNPRHPYFFVHEYKPLNKSTPSDPLGQLVAAMMVAQITNDDEQPIYGLYVRGEFWVFVVLHGKEYAESKTYNATQTDDLKQILQALFWVKQYIEHRIDTDNNLENNV
jgi:hypothetical protein